ncbi:MAG: hypothetical protein B6D59_00305 [Campylobacteraceae bacterium 4484_4]|nr:MAG: hypothetical protein B6D59_00305 [Campylobacteraceae bacterium 4484_4]
MKKEKFTINELSAFVDMTPRNIRFYIQQGVVDKPIGQKKGAYYTQHHLRQLLTVKKYREAGVSLERIAQIIHEENTDHEISYPVVPGKIEVISRIFLTAGVELTIDPEKSGLRQEEIRTLGKRILEIIEQLQKKDKR